jgi:ABC-type microcin C transport system duplicated ATPase subunit YejF
MVPLLLEKLSGGNLLFHGKDVSDFGRAELKEYRSNVQAVFQDPVGLHEPADAGENHRG